MENLDHLVDLITDRLMEKLKEKSLRKPSVYVIGGDKIPDLLEGERLSSRKRFLHSRDCCC